ncbi:hypothetical protein ANCCEY_09358 [Ancylostoma ceylanicum]|uniref:Uncharacterized protein n=1 Tax=Ancylostoma ceylanicum TaxID=53326 RepID=A0A0D6LNC3_9BILA|nr:hypothetical protein ANCCEY_09358 [Ancylostoma ceylanicum]
MRHLNVVLIIGITTIFLFLNIYGLIEILRFLRDKQLQQSRRILDEELSEREDVTTTTTSVTTKPSPTVATSLIFRPKATASRPTPSRFTPSRITPSRTTPSRTSPSRTAPPRTTIGWTTNRIVPSSTYRHPKPHGHGRTHVPEHPHRHHHTPIHRIHPHIVPDPTTDRSRIEIHRPQPNTMPPPTEKPSINEIFTNHPTRIVNSNRPPHTRPTTTIPPNENYDFIHKYRKNMGEMHRTKIHLITLHDLPLSRHLDAANKIIQEERQDERLWRSIWDPAMKDHPEARSAEYDVLVNSKTYFLYNATLEDPFSTEFFVWIDAGYGHGNQSVFPYNNKWKPRFPRNKISLIKLTPVHDSISGYTIDSLYRRNWSVVSGGFVAGDKRSIGQLHTLVHRKFIELTYHNKVDDDQTVLVLVINQHPHLFSITHGDWFDAFRLFGPDEHLYTR